MDHPYSISDFAFSFRRRNGTTRDLIGKKPPTLQKEAPFAREAGTRQGAKIRVGPIVALTVRERSIEAGTANTHCAIPKFQYAQRPGQVPRRAGRRSYALRLQRRPFPDGK